ncbi:MAG: magnesium transporter [bacterium]
MSQTPANTENHHNNTGTTPPPDDKDQQTEEVIHSEDRVLTPEFVGAVETAVQEGDEEQVARLCGDLHPADIADLLEQIDPENRSILVTMLGESFEATALVELDEDVRDEVIEAMPTEQLAEAVSELETDDAAFVLEDMEEGARAEVLAEVPMAERLALQAALDFDEDTAGRLMQRDYFAAPAYWTVGQIINRLRSAEDLPEKFYEVFVIDPTYKVIGSVPLAKFLRSSRDTVISDLIEDSEPFTIPINMDKEEVAYLFEKYNLISAPVIDDAGRLVGMITVDDVVEIVHEETHEDMLALGGVEADQSGMSGSLAKTIRSRFSWLAVNLFTAILASLVISLFDATLEQMVAVAILMPIVASMGGNAGTQTLTVAVRNLATKDLTASNALRVIGRELMVAFINGSAFAIMMGSLAALWFSVFGKSDEAITLGLVLAAAMIINMICAGLAGILIPLGLQRAGYDPAVSSTVFVTTVTDVIGFLSFLGLAALYLV